MVVVIHQDTSENDDANVNSIPVSLTLILIQMITPTVSQIIPKMSQKVILTGDYSDNDH